MTTMHLTNECWLGYHDHCVYDAYCDCLCHVKQDSMFQELMEYLMKEQEE